MCCRNDYRLSIYFLSECTQLRFVQLFNKALLLLLSLLLLFAVKAVKQLRNSISKSQRKTSRVFSLIKPLTALSAPLIFAA